MTVLRHSPRHARHMLVDVKRTRRRRVWLIAIAVLLIVVLGAAAWIGVRALMAKKDLDVALPLASQIKADILAGNSKAAMKSVSRAADKISNAKDLTSDVVWRAAEIVPWVGGNLRNVRELTDIADGVFVNAVTPLSSIAKDLSPTSLKPKDGAIDIAPLVSARPIVEKATTAVLSAQSRLHGLDTAGSISQVRDGTTKFSSMIDAIAPQLKLANKALAVLPGLMGEESPRHYLLLFQNSAEPRALGGTTGAMVLLTVDKGKVELGQQASGLDFVKYPSSVIPESDDTASVYGAEFATDVLNTTLTPSFSVSAKTAQVMWKNAFGAEIDGVASIDPGALALIIKATGPVKLSTGDTLNAGNAVGMLLNGIYQRYPGLSTAENLKQDAFFGAAVSATFAKVTAGAFDPATIMKSLVQGVQDRRIMFWSANKQEQELVSSLGLTPEPPRSDANVDRAGLYVQDAVGSKLEYYLSQKVTASQAVCRADGRQSYRLSFDLTSQVPADPLKSVPAYVLGVYKGEKVPPGTMRLDVMTYAPDGSTIVGGSVNGTAFDPGTLKDGANPVSKVRIEISPGTTVNVTFDIVAAKPGKKALDVTVTPLVRATPITKDALDCGTAASK